MIAGEFGSEVVKPVRHILQSAQEYKRRAGTTPIEYLELHPRPNRYEFDTMAGGIRPLRG
jgi:hypothetical protein